jgi:hypothetical protein
MPSHIAPALAALGSDALVLITVASIAVVLIVAQLYAAEWR